MARMHSPLVVLRCFADMLVILAGSFFQTKREERGRERLLVNWKREIRAY